MIVQIATLVKDFVAVHRHALPAALFSGPSQKLLDIVKECNPGHSDSTAKME